MVSICQELRSRLTWEFWLRVPYKVVVRGQLGLQSSEDWVRLDDLPPPRWPTLRAGTLVLAVSERPYFLPYWASPQSSYNMATEFPYSEQSKRPRWKTQCLLWLDLPVKCHHIYRGLLAPQASLASVWEGATQEHEYQRWGSLRWGSWEAGYHSF